METKEYITLFISLFVLLVGIAGAIFLSLRISDFIGLQKGQYWCGFFTLFCILTSLMFNPALRRKND